jgi:uncharacterized protein
MSPSTAEVGRSAVGQGIFATRPLQPGQAILVLSGTLLDRTQVLGRDRAYALQSGPHHDLELTAPGRFLNHSCDPNVGIVNDRVLIALRRIEAGEEIRYDYSTTMSEDHWTVECRCGEPTCRRVVLGFHHLPPITQNRYLQLGIVQRFIVDEVRRRSPARRVARRRAARQQISL